MRQLIDSLWPRLLFDTFVPFDSVTFALYYSRSTMEVYMKRICLIDLTDDVYNQHIYMQINQSKLFCSTADSFFIFSKSKPNSSKVLT